MYFVVIILLVACFHTRISWRSFTGVWMIASLQDSPQYSGWSQSPVPSSDLWEPFQIELVLPLLSCSTAFKKNSLAFSISDLPGRQSPLFFLFSSGFLTEIRLDRLGLWNTQTSSLQRSKPPLPMSVLHETIWCWGARDTGSLGNAEYLFFVISSRSTVARSGSTWQGPIYRPNGTVWHLKWVQKIIYAKLNC